MKLTPREYEIMFAVSKGYTNRQIGLKLGITEQTVKNHLSSIFAKLKATNRMTAVIAFNKLGG